MEHLEIIKQILKNLKKTPSRQYRLTTIVKKLKELETIKLKFIGDLKLEKDSKITSNLRLEFDEIYEITKALLNKKLEDKKEDSKELEEEEENSDEEEKLEEENSELNRTLTEEEIMSNFNIDTAIKAIPIFGGSYKEIDSFSTISTLISNNLNVDGKKDLLNFIFHVKLSNTVKTALGSQSTPANLDSLISLLKERYKNKVTLPQILNKLSNMTQRNHSITSFKDHLLNIIGDLNRLQIEQLGSTVTEVQKQVIITTNDIQALHIFKNGLDDKIKTTVIAAQPKTLTDAVNIALEVETNNSNQIMHINRAGSNTRYSNNNNRYNNNNNRYYNNSNGNRNFSNRNNSNNNFSRNRNNTNNNYQRNDNNNNNRTARVHLTNKQGNDQGSDYNNPESQN